MYKKTFFKILIIFLFILYLNKIMNYIKIIIIKIKKTIIKY